MAFDLTAVLRLRDAGFTSGMRNARRSMDGLRGGASEVVKQLGLVTGAAGIVGAAFMSAKKAMDFESEMSTIKALTGSTNAQMDQMRKLALDMGQKTKYSALEAGQGIEELLKAGLTPATVKAGGLEAALNLATAGGLDLKDAAEIMSTSLNAFSKDGMKASQAANILAGTANASATDVNDLKFSLSMVAAVASGAGLSFKDTNAALGVLANKGLKGSDAGTSLKSMLLQLQPTTKKSTKLFEALGLQTGKTGNAFYDSKGHIKSMADIAQVLHDKFKNLTDGERQAAFKQAFGTDAIRAANILYEAGAKGINQFQNAMSHVTAFDVAKQKMNNAAGAVEVFKGALETFQIQVMTPLLPVIKNMALHFADWMSNIKPSQVQSWGNSIKNAGQNVLKFANFVHNNWTDIKGVILGIAGGLAILKVGLKGMMIISTITKLFKAWRAATLAETLAEMGLNAAMLLNPITWIIVGVAALVAGVIILVNHLGGWAKTWNLIQRGAATAVNFVIGMINKLIGVLNKIPGVSIPIIPKVEWGKAVDPAGGKKIVGTKSVLPVSKGIQGTGGKTYAPNSLSNQFKGFSHAGGLYRVPYDNYPAILHRNESVLTPTNADKYRNGKNRGSFTIEGGIHLYGVGGDLESAADKLMDIMANKIQTAGGAGA